MATHNTQKYPTPDWIGVVFLFVYAVSLNLFNCKNIMITNWRVRNHEHATVKMEILGKQIAIQEVSFMSLFHHKLNHRNYFSYWNHKILPHENIYINLTDIKNFGINTQKRPPLPRCRVDLTRWYTSLWLGSMCPLRFSDMLCRPNPSRLNSPRGLVGDLYTCITCN